MARYRNPKCRNFDEETGRHCNTEMRLLGERHPLWQPGFYNFICPKCESVRCIDDLHVDRVAERV